MLNIGADNRSTPNIFRPLRDDPCDSRRSEFFFFWRGGCLVGYCMMIEIAQMALSYYQNKLQKYFFLKHYGLNDPESSRHHLQDSDKHSKRQTQAEAATRPSDFF